MQFMWDKNKDKENIEKHKVGFEEAKAIWNDADLLVVSARKRGEKRFLAIGETFCVLYSVVFTKRSQAIRIISARRSTEKERKLYEKHRNN